MRQKRFACMQSCRPPKPTITSERVATEAAQAAADHLARYVDCQGVRPITLHALEERLDAQEPQEISVAESLAILFGGLLGLAILVIVAMAVW